MADKETILVTPVPQHFVLATGQIGGVPCWKL